MSRRMTLAAALVSFRAATKELPRTTEALVGGRVKFLKMDIDANPATPSKLGIMSIPTLIIFKDGRPAERTVGYRSNMKGDLREKLEALL